MSILFNEDWYDFLSPCHNQCLINGQIIDYDVCGSKSLEDTKSFYGDNYEYIGSSFTTYHDGVKNEWDELHHFFNIKNP